MVLAILALVITLILVIGIHEAGHALVARWFKVSVKRISIGFGRPLFLWRKKSGYELVWALWPFGGSVYLLNSRIFSVEPAEYPHCFDKQAVWRRISILLAGSFANLITAWLSLILVFFVGLRYEVPVVQTVQASSIAWKAGILSGDQFITIARQPILGWREVGMKLIELWGSRDVEVTMQSREGRLKIVHLNLSQVNFRGQKASLLTSLGIIPDLQAQKKVQRSDSLLTVISYANITIRTELHFFWIILKQLFTGVIPFTAMIGPLGFLAVTIATFSQGFAVFMYFIALLSLAVALVNVFPIPILDGGSIVYALLEKIRGKPISVELELLIHRLFLIVFFLLLVHLITNDLQRIYS